MSQAFTQLLQNFGIQLDGELDLDNKKAKFAAQAGGINFEQELKSCMQDILRLLTAENPERIAAELAKQLLIFDLLLQAKLSLESIEKSLVLNADSRTEELEKFLMRYPSVELVRLKALQDNEAPELSNGKVAFVIMNLATMAEFKLSRRLEIKLDLDAIVRVTSTDAELSDYTQQTLLGQNLLGLQQQFQTARAVPPNLAEEKELKERVWHAQEDPEKLIKGSTKTLTPEQVIAKCYYKREQEVGRGKSYAITTGLRERTEQLDIDALKRSYSDELNVSDESLQDFHIHALLQATRISDTSLTGLGITHVLQNCLNDFIMVISDPGTMGGAQTLSLDAANRRLNAKPVKSQPGAVLYEVDVAVLRHDKEIGMLRYDFTITADKQLSINSPTFTLNELAKSEETELCNNAMREFTAPNCCFINNESMHKPVKPAESFLSATVKPSIAKAPAPSKPIDTLPATGMKAGATFGGIAGAVLGGIVATIFSPVLGPLALLVFAGMTFAGATVGAGMGYVVGKGIENLTVSKDKPSMAGNPYAHSVLKQKSPKSEIVKEEAIIEELQRRQKALQHLPTLRPVIGTGENLCTKDTAQVNYNACVHAPANS
jgi:hypothetical protein